MQGTIHEAVLYFFCQEACHEQQFQITGAEVGVMGGFPAAGPLFGAAYNPEAIMPTSTMIDLIQGGNLDAAVLGCAEVGSTRNASLGKSHRNLNGIFMLCLAAKIVIPVR